MIIKGQKINDRYEIIRTIGEGGMANVYLAIDTILDRKVAVKVLRGDLATDEKFVRRFQREANAASRLNHPNIVEIYDVGEDDGMYYIVMEYVEGQTLKNLIKKRGGLTLPEVIDIMLQLTSGIACAHESYIIHRDIKPQNIMILDDGRVKITDFGIAQTLNSTDLTQTNSVMGSVHYLPPEQANGGASTIKSDIYSTGILMYELITGRVPFRGENAVEIAIKQMKEPIPSISDFRDDVPQSVENIIIKACAKNPKNRYDSIVDMRNDIEVCLSKEHSLDPKIELPYPEHEDDYQEINITRSEKNAKRNEEIEEIEENEIEKENKKSNKGVVIVSIILGIIILGVVISLLVLNMSNNKKSDSNKIEVPDVTKYTLEKATDELERLGFTVDTTVKEEYSDSIEEGNVIKTLPKAGKKVSKNTVITLTVSSGSENIKIEDYKGKNYEEVKNELEELGINVKIEKEEHDSKDENYKENIIINQDLAAGSTLKVGDSLTLVIPSLITVYPDFTDGTYTLNDIEDFCSQNSITLVKEYTESDKKEGTILNQSRAAGTKVYNNVTLKITIAKAKTVVSKPEDTKTDTTKTDTTKTDTTKTDTTKTDTTKNDGQSTNA